MAPALIYTISVINLGLYIYLIVLLLHKIRISKAHRRLLILLISSFGWLFCVNWMTLKPEFTFFVTLVRINFSLAPIIAASFLLFIFHFPNKHPTLSLLKEFLYISPLLILAFLSYSNLFINVEDYYTYSHSFFYYLYIAILFIYLMVINLFIGISKLKQLIDIQKRQISYILFGYYVAIAILFCESIYQNSNNFISPTIDRILLNCSLLFIALAAYAMLRYRFMDIRVVIRRSLIYGISLLLTLALYTYLALTIKDSIEKSWNVNSSWTAVILIALVALGFPPLKTLVEKAVDALFKGKKSIDLAVKELREQASQKKDLDALVELVSNSIVKYLEVEWVKFFIISHREHSYVFEGEGETARIEPGNELVRYFEKYPEAVVRDEIPHLIEEKEGKFEKEMLQKVEKEMKKRNASLALPFKTEDELYSFAFLGNKREGGVYSVQDVEYLVQLREQVNFTLASAVLYRDAMERIHVQIANNQ